MMKKILKPLLALISILFVLLVGILLTLITDFKPIMLKAYYLAENNYNGNALSINPNDYYHDNLIIIPHKTGNCNGVNYTIDNNKVTLNGTSWNYCEFEIWKGSFNGTYTTKIFKNTNGPSDSSMYFYNNGSFDSVIQFNGGISKTTNYNLTMLKVGFSNGVNFNNFQFDIMLVEGSNVPTDYHKPYAFGYLVQSIDSDDFVMTFRDNYNTSNIYTLQGYTPLYLPFQYINNNMVTFSYNVNSYSISGSQIHSNISYYPVFSGTNKNTNNDDMISNLVYTYNYMYYSNFSIIPTDNVCAGDGLYITYLSNDYDINEYPLETFNCSYRINVISEFNSTIKQSNIIDYKPYFNFSNPIYSFKINTLSLPIDYTFYYNMSFDSIVLGIKNEQIGGAVPINTSGSEEIYNSCGNFFTDFNCYAGNAVTYVIYNIPFLGSLFALLRGMVQIINSTVIMFKWYQDFGIIFSVVILLLMMRVVIMLLKGSNDDRGGNKKE